MNNFEDLYRIRDGAIEEFNPATGDFVDLCEQAECVVRVTDDAINFELKVEEPDNRVILTKSINRINGAMEGTNIIWSKDLGREIRSRVYGECERVERAPPRAV